MNATFAGLVASALLVCTLQSGWAEPPPAPAAGPGKHIMVAPEDVVWGQCPPALPPGAECATIEGDPQIPGALFTIRSKLPDHYRIPPHFHPTDEHITVISGTFAMGLGKDFTEKAMKPMAAGSFMVMPKDTPHFALTRGETIVQVHAVGPLVFTYVNRNDDPRQRRDGRE